MRGDPRCSFCHGVGGFRIAGTWRKCPCVIVDTRTRQATARAAEIRTGHKPLTMDDMLRAGSSEKARENNGR